MTTYNIQINDKQLELIHRALSHLNEVDCQYHEDLCNDEDPSNRTPLGGQLHILTDGLDPDKVGQDDYLEHSSKLNKLC